MDWIKIAVRFDLGECKYHGRPLAIEQRKQTDGRTLWVLKMNEWVLGKDGLFHYEPIPSARTQGHIELTRFNSPDDCLQFYNENITSSQPLRIS